jgi:hypothetical protein
LNLDAVSRVSNLVFKFGIRMNLLLFSFRLPLPNKSYLI